jgi:hypothetical protein
MHLSFHVSLRGAFFATKQSPSEFNREIVQKLGIALEFAIPYELIIFAL